MIDLADLSPFVLDLTGSRPVTMNHERGKASRWDQAAATKVWREAAGWTARDARIPAMDSLAVVVTPLYRDARSPQDVAACAPSAKAAVDGLVDVEVIPNDTPRHFVECVFRPGIIVGQDGMRLEVYDTSGVADTTAFGRRHLMIPLPPAAVAALAELCGSTRTDRMTACAAQILAEHLERTAT